MSNELQVFPDWGRKWPLWMGTAVHPDSLGIPADIADRLRQWTFEWQTILNPQKVIQWPDDEVGRRWVRDGEQLVADLQSFLGDRVRVVGDFGDYDPDRDV
jgi:hypothetical protein